MFTGIIETTGIVTEIADAGTNKSFWIDSSISPQLSIDQSVSHDGICLTVEAILDSRHRITAIDETITKTNIGNWIKNSVINLERCLPMNGRIDGHIVQGHVDAVASCVNIIDKNGSREYIFEFDKQYSALVIEKGSITINGISLTIFNVAADRFQVAIIPYTMEHTNMKYVQKGDHVNIEFDMIGKYVNRFMQFKQ
jgi:riboflavin synthase